MSFDEPEGIDDDTEVIFDMEQFLRQQNTAHVTPPPLAYTQPLPFLATMEPLDALLMGDEVFSTTPIRENNEFVKSSVDLVPISKESEVTSVCNDLECSMPFDSPSWPCTDVLGDEKVDIDLPFGEQVNTLLMGDMEINLNSLRDVGNIGSSLADDPVIIARMSDEPLGNSDSMSRSFDTSDILLEEFTSKIGLMMGIAIRRYDDASRIVTKLWREVGSFVQIIRCLRSGTLPSTKASVSLVHDYKGLGVPILYAADNFIIQRSISNISLIGAQSIIGRAVVVHAYPDDLGKSGPELSKSTGNASQIRLKLNWLYQFKADKQSQTPLKIAYVFIPAASKQFHVAFKSRLGVVFIFSNVVFVFRWVAAIVFGSVIQKPNTSSKKDNGDSDNIMSSCKRFGFALTEVPQLLYAKGLSNKNLFQDVDKANPKLNGEQAIQKAEQIISSGDIVDLELSPEQVNQEAEQIISYGDKVTYESVDNSNFTGNQFSSNAIDDINNQTYLTSMKKKDLSDSPSSKTGLTQVSKNNENSGKKLQAVIGEEDKSINVNDVDEKPMRHVISSRQLKKQLKKLSINNNSNTNKDDTADIWGDGV
ncbi:NAC domain-containing protein, partial [Tanacetum coccineum]